MPSTGHHSITTRSDTRAVTIQAPATEVFAFIANPENLPRWAVGFCRAIRPDLEKAGWWIVRTAQGDLPVRYVTDIQRGTIDFYLCPTPDVDVPAFSRVIPNGNGADYVFTQHQPPGMPDEVFERQVHALLEELQVLRALIQARLACPT